MAPPPDPQTVDTVVAIIAVLALLIGLASMGFGKAVEGYDRARAWWQEGLDKARAVNDFDDEILSTDDDEPLGTGSEPPQNHPGSADTPAERTSSHADREPPAATFHNHLSRLEVLTLLAVQKGDDGEYVYSANRIADLVGGARQRTLEQINAVRGGRKEEPRTSNNHLSRPEKGWG